MYFLLSILLIEIKLKIHKDFFYIVLCIVFVYFVIILSNFKTCGIITLEKKKIKLEAKLL